MGLLLELGRLVEECRAEHEALLREEAPSFVCREQVGNPPNTEAELGNWMAQADNQEFMSWLLLEKGMAGKLDLIYIDPPFFSKADYGAEIRMNAGKIKTPALMKQKAYHDTWENGMEEYLRMLTRRLLLMKELLAETGGIWVHLDWHVVHYVKIIMDELFGEKNFVNEIIWTYKSGGVSTRHFARKHDTLLYYAKGKEYYFQAHKEKSYNRGYKPYRFKGVKEYKDELGWYTMVNRKDVWQIDMVGRTAAERTGYATQKPEALLERILESCTEEGDLCADFFSGSGTLAAVAEKLGRRWICCDAGTLAIAGSKNRLARSHADFSCFYSKESSGPRASAGKVSVEIALQDNSLSDTILLSVTLAGYALPGLSQMPIGEEQLKTVKKIIRKDPLSLVDFWSVDFHFDHKIFRPELFFYREKNKLTVKTEMLRKKEDVAQGVTVALQAYDVFGNCGFWAETVFLKGGNEIGTKEKAEADR